MIRAAIVLAALLELLVARVLPESGVGLYARLAAALVVLLLPGGLIAEALGRRSASATLLWTLAAVFGALTVVFALDASLDLALWLLAAVSVGALVAARRQERPPRFAGSALVGAAGVLFGIALWHVAGHVDGDGLFHLARTRKLVALGDLDLATVNEFADGGLHPGYAFPLWHGFLALLARLAGVDPELVVLHGPSVFAPVAFLVAYESGVALFRSAWAGAAVLAAQVAQIALAAGHGGAYASLALPGAASRQLVVPAILTLVFAHLYEPSRAVLAGIAAGALALTLVHPTYALFLGLPLVGFAAVRALWSRADARRLAGALVVYALPPAAALVWLLPVVNETVARNPSEAELARALRQYGAQLDVIGDGYRLAPEVLARGGAVAVAALALLPLAGVAVRRRWAAWVLGGSLPVLALMLVPELFTRLSDATSLSQSRRAAGFLPFAFAFAGGLVALAGPLRRALPAVALAAGVALQLAYPGDFTLTLERGGGPAAVVWWALAGGVLALAAGLVLRREPLDRRSPLVAAGALAFVLPVLVHSAANWTPSPARRPNPLSPGLVTAVRMHVPERSVVFSDLETSYRIAAAAPVYVAAAPPAHVANTEPNRPYERREDVLRFFRSGDLAIPRSYGADYVVLDRRRTELSLPLRLIHRDGRYVLYGV